MRVLFFAIVIFIFSCTEKPAVQHNLRLWYDEPATKCTEALPVGTGRLAAMVYGSVAREHIQFNEETLWTGQPHDYANEGASQYLAEIRQLLSDGQQEKATALAMDKFMSDPLRQKTYQPFGDLFINFAGLNSCLEWLSFMKRK